MNVQMERQNPRGETQGDGETQRTDPFFYILYIPSQWLADTSLFLKIRRVSTLLVPERFHYIEKKRNEVIYSQTKSV